jgi:hypothetical protein
MLERFRLLGLIGALCRIVRREIGAGRCFVVIDDTRRAVRSMRPAPRGVSTMRPAFLLCQCFVTLVVPCRDRPRSVPLVSGLCRSLGNAGKLATRDARSVTQSACCSTPCAAR